MEITKRLSILAISVSFILVGDATTNRIEGKQKELSHLLTIKNVSKAKKKFKKSTNKSHKAYIRSFNLKKDKKFIINALRKEWDFLVGGKNACTPALTPHSVFKEMLKNTIKILCVGHKHAGVITYSKKGHVNLINVHPKFRKKGYAMQLLKYAEKKLSKKKVKKMTLEVFNYNYKAIKCFKKAGFKRKTGSFLIEMYKVLKKN